MSAKKLERFEPTADCAPGMASSDSGDWVRYEDAEKLEKERDEAVDALRRIDSVEFVGEALVHAIARRVLARLSGGDDAPGE